MQYLDMIAQATLALSSLCFISILVILFISMIILGLHILIGIIYALTGKGENIYMMLENILP